MVDASEFATADPDLVRAQQVVGGQDRHIMGKVPRPGLSELGPLVRYQRHDELSQLPLWPMEARNPDTGHQAR